MHQSIIIIEDFYDDPMAIRNMALELGYSAGKNSTYPGVNSTTAFFPEEAQQKLNFIAGEELIPTPNMANGLFRLSPGNCVHKQDIHIDPGSDWAGVLFLNLPEQCQGGTYFWKHNKYGFEHCPSSPEEGAAYGFSSYEQIQKEIIYGDGLDRNKWERTVKASMKFNRLVLFRPWMWHSHGENFGVTKHDARLVQLFFLKNKQVQNIIQETHVVQEEPKISELNKMIDSFENHHNLKNNSVTIFGTPENPVAPKYFFEE